MSSGRPHDPHDDPTMKNIYLYPITGRYNSGVSNPYIDHLAESLSGPYQIVNRNFPSSKGIMDVVKYLKNTDILYLNWIENLPDRHGGYFQSLFFFLLCGYCRITRKKIVWTLHNKRSHSGNNRFLKNLLFRYMLVRSDLVITHAEEGLELVPGRTGKVFIPHPVTMSGSPVPSQEEKAYDIIIWGTIALYKGVDTFLRFLKDEGVLDNYRILVAGKVLEPGLLEFLEDLSGSCKNLTLINQFVPDPELARLIGETGVILFTYHSTSVLSSGALMDSLRYNANILGPHTGAFLDLAGANLIRTFKDYQDLLDQIELLKKKEYREPFRAECKRKFLEEHAWNRFHLKISPHIRKIFPKG